MSIFNAEDSNDYNPYEDINRWKSSIEERGNRPLTMKEYEQWYEVVANCEMNSQVHYMNYLRDYHNKYNKYTHEPEDEPEDEHKPEDQPEIEVPETINTSITEEQLFSKLSEVTNECNLLKQENERYKTMLNNFQNNYAFSPIRPARPPVESLRPPKLERKINKKNVRFIHGTPTRLFPIKSERTMKMTDIHPNRLRKILVSNEDIQFPKFFKASELMKKLDNPHEDILSEGI